MTNSNNRSLNLNNCNGINLINPKKSAEHWSTCQRPILTVGLPLRFGLHSTSPGAHSIPPTDSMDPHTDQPVSRGRVVSQAVFD